jgi:lysophospholipase L1-like esterase
MPSFLLPKILHPRVRFTTGVAAVLVATLCAGTSTAPAMGPITAAFVGDSVAASISYTPQARTVLSRGLKVRLDLRVCRRLVTAGCADQGSTPPSALRAVQSLGRSLGDVLIVYVGYNESSSGYGKGVDQIMRAALRQGVKGVVWVTLREERDIYRQTNTTIRTAARRWPQIQVADWNAYSAGRPWFSSDGLHMSAAGAQGLAQFLRPYVFRAAEG